MVVRSKRSKFLSFYLFWVILGKSPNVICISSSIIRLACWSIFCRSWWFSELLCKAVNVVPDTQLSAFKPRQGHSWAQLHKTFISTTSYLGVHAYTFHSFMLVWLLPCINTFPSFLTLSLFFSVIFYLCLTTQIWFLIHHLCYDFAPFRSWVWPPGRVTPPMAA